MVWPDRVVECDVRADAAKTGVAGEPAENARTANAPPSARINGRILIKLPPG
jgi:hypothetical protein